MVTAIIVAAGKSERMGAGTDKAFLNLGPKPVLAWSLLAFERCTDVDQVVVVVRKDQIVATKALARMFGISKIRAVVAGGAKRQDSVANGLKEIDADTRIVVVHDGARPCVKPETISGTVKVAKRVGAAVVGCHIWDTVKFVEKGNTVTRTEDRSKLWAVQTPQAFSASGRCCGAQLASIRQMSGQVSRGSADEYQADERAGVTGLSWRLSGR